MTTSFTLGELAGRFGLVCQGDAAYVVTGLATLRSARSDQLSFLANPRYTAILQQTAAGAVILAPAISDCFTGNRLLADDPYLAYAKISRLFAPSRPAAAIHPTAVIGSDCQLGEGCYLGPNAVIGDGVVLGADCHVGPGTVIGEGCQLGQGCHLHANVTLYPGVILGQRVVVHSGAVLGADGFGFAPSADGWEKIAQLGGLVVGDDVDIGAGTTIDRGALDDTVIGRGVILDNQIQIAHNVRIGDYTAIAGCAAIAGSTRIGSRCTIAGRASIIGHLEIADNCHITVGSLVTESITEQGSYSSGTFSQPTRQWRRNAVRFNQLDELFKRVRALEQNNNDNQ